MSPLEAARKMAADNPMRSNEQGWSSCAFCYPDDSEHEKDCPWRAMPQIIVALEAAQVLTDQANERGLLTIMGYLLDQDEVEALAQALKG